MTRRRLFGLTLTMLLVVAVLLPRACDGERRPVEEGRRNAAIHGIVRLSDGLVHYQIGGAGRVPVVLIHGVSGPMAVWDKTYAALVSAGFRVLRYDLYGRGWSDRPAVSYDPAL